MTRVLVTGGAGFIGSHIVESFLNSGSRVLVIDDLSSGRLENLPPDHQALEFCQASITSAEAAIAASEFEPHILVHCAAQISVRVSMEDPVADSKVNVTGLLNILHAFAEKEAPFVVFISTGGAIYGEQKSFPAAEDHPIAPTSIYGLAKRIGEMYLEFWQRELGLEFAALRLANVYGPRQNPHGEAGVVAIFNQTLLSGGTPKIYGSGEQTRDFVFVKDVVRAVRAVGDERIRGIFNVGTGVETSVNQLYSYIAEAVGSSTQAEYFESKAGEQMRSCIDASLALKSFEWKPEYSIREGLEETASWFREQQ